MGTEIKPEILIDIKPAAMESSRVSGPFDKALEVLTENDYELISLPQNALLRIQQGVHSYISENANWTRETFVYDKQRGIYLTKIPLIMENAGEATRVHREGKNYLLTDEQVERALEDSVRIEDLVRVGERGIPTNRFGENELTNYVFDEIAQQYGQFLQDFGIKAMPIWLADLIDKPFATQMWFRSLIDSSVLYGAGKDLHDDRRLRGVKAA